jgi:hypothetical protein
VAAKLKLTKDTKRVVYTEEHKTFFQEDTIPQDMFRGNKNLTSVRIHEGVSIIEKGTFEGCDRLSKITIPASVKVIEQDAFVGCSDLKTVKLAASVVEIEHWIGRGVKEFIHKEDLVKTLKEGKEVKLLSKEDIDHWA